MEEKQDKKKKINKWIKLAVFALITAAAVFLMIKFEVGTKISDFFKAGLTFIDSIGFWAPFIFIIIYIAATVLFLPGSVLTLGAGFLFGVVRGSIYVSVASTVGATLAFIIGRYFLRDWVTRKIESNNSFRAVNNAAAEEGWKIVGLLRLSPVFPFNLLNYALGVTKVKLHHYILASWIGMMPGTVMYVYFGSLAGDSATLDSGAGQNPTAVWTIRIIGLIATVAVTLFVTRIAKKALTQRLDEK